MYSLAVHKAIKFRFPILSDVKGIKNGRPLVGDPARAVGECKDVAKAQP